MGVYARIVVYCNTAVAISALYLTGVHDRQYFLRSAVMILQIQFQYCN